MSKFKPDDEQLYRDNQLKNLKYMIEEIDWDKLEYNGELSFSDNDTNVTKRNHNVYFHTMFDIIDNDCIIHPDKPHSESFKYLPSYIISGDYAKYMIHKEIKYKEMVKTGYDILDFKFPYTVNVHISPITKLGSIQFFDRKGDITGFTDSTIKNLLKQLEKSIKMYSLPYITKVNTSNSIINIEVYSNELKKEAKPLFRFHFGSIKSLEIVMIQGLQIDSSKIYHC